MTRESRSVFTALTIGLILLGSGPGVAVGQSADRFGAGWFAGGSYLTSLNADAGGPEVEDLAPGAGFSVGLHLDRWYGEERRLGVRLDGAYQQPRFDWVQGRRKIDVASAHVSGMLRLLAPEEDRLAGPYISVGAGGTWYDLGTGPRTTYAPADAYHDGSSRIIPSAQLAAGVDIRTPWSRGRSPVNLRLEVADHVSRSPLRNPEDGSRHDIVHNVRFTVGAYAAISR